jgi:hypothetical protein
VKKTRCVISDVAEQFAAQFTARGHKGVTRDPAREPPQEVVGGHQTYQQCEGHPDHLAVAAGQRIDKRFYTVLGADRAGGGANDRRQNRGMRYRPAGDVAKKKGRTVGRRAG